MTEMKKRNPEVLTGIITIAFAVLGAVFFGLSYTTGYYTFGQMNSKIVLSLIAVAIVVEIVYLVLQKKIRDTIFAPVFNWAVMAMLMAAALLLVGDRVEGIGNCIVTDYDSGHGGEQAIYMSLAGSILMVIGAIYNIIGSFSVVSEKKHTVGNIIKSVLAVVLAAAVAFEGLSLGDIISVGGIGGAGDSEYTISYNQANGNCDEGVMPTCQFLCTDLSGVVRADARFYIDITLTLKDDGTYNLYSEAYVVESGKRAEIGDDSGLGQNINTTAEGTYVDNGDGTVTISQATTATFTMETDTYSSQMKSAFQMEVDGSTDDGVYSSDEYPSVLDFVPEATFTLEDGAIVSYVTAGGDEYTVSYNQANGNTDEGVMPDYQFLCCNFAGMVRADSRFYVDLYLDLDADAGTYELKADSYVIEAGNRAEVGDDTGLGLVLTMDATGTYTDNGDGTVTIDKAEHAVFEMETDTYSSQMKSAAGMAVGDTDEDGVYDSNDYPVVLDFVPASTFTLEDGAIVSYEKAGEVYTVSYNQANGNTDEGVMPDYQFLCCNFAGMVRADSRFYVDLSLSLNEEDGTYVLKTDSYVIEAGKRAEVGDDTGLGLVLTMNATGTYTDNGDGTVTIDKAEHATFEMETDTYSSQMKSAAGMEVDGSDEDGIYDSNDVPAVLDFVPASTFTLADGAIVSYEKA